MVFVKQYKYFVFALLLFLIIAAGSYYVKYDIKRPINLVADIQEKNVNVKLVVDTGTNKYEFSESVNASSTVFDLLKQASTEKNFSFVYKDSSLGVFVEEIYGVKNDTASNKYWMYKVNEQLSNVGASNQKIIEGDLVDWYYGVVSGY